MKRDVVDAIESLLAHRTEDLGCYEFVLEAWMEEAASEINRLRSERRWIPVGERLPDEGQRVLAHYDGRVFTADLFEGMWHWIEGKMMNAPVDHWMPLPEPPSAL